MDSISQFLDSLLNLNEGNLTGMRVLTAVGIAYLGGILSSLTPCIYPMIPITVSVVGGLSGDGSAKNASKNSRLFKLLLGGLAYILGMTVIYSFLGVAAGISGKVFGAMTNTKGWYLGLGIVMSFASLVMLDIIPFDPAVWFETAKRKILGGRKHNPSPVLKQEMTWLGAFGLGASSGFIAAPCTTPVLTSILAFIAKTQSVFLGLTLMISFSLGLGTLLLVIAVFTSALKVLPRSGAWMKTMKTLSGLLLLFFAEYLVYKAGGF